jgi:hypothetical protein
MDEEPKMKGDSGKVTLFELVPATFACGGLAAGWLKGSQWGLLPGTICAIIGLPIGFVIGIAFMKALVWIVGLDRRDLRKTKEQ